MAALSEMDDEDAPAEEAASDKTEEEKDIITQTGEQLEVRKESPLGTRQQRNKKAD